MAGIRLQIDLQIYITETVTTSSLKTIGIPYSTEIVM
nr:MAG TPA_asm: hypothetical protein [Caudoviricetes sp.]